MTEACWHRIGTCVAAAVETVGPSTGRPTGSSAEFWTPRIAPLFGCSTGAISIRGATGCPPEMTINGEPTRVSFSQTAGARACAVGITGNASAPIGVDVEADVDLPDAAAMLAVAASVREVERTTAVFGEDPGRVLLRVWTAKEAALKAMGIGLRIEPIEAELVVVRGAGCDIDCRGHRFTIQWLIAHHCIAAIASAAGAH